MEPKISQNYNIFNALYEALQKKESKKLRFAKCTECGRVTPYKLKSLEGTAVQCKKCGTPIPISSR